MDFQINTPCPISEKRAEISKFKRAMKGSYWTISLLRFFMPRLRKFDIFMNFKKKGGWKKQNIDRLYDINTQQILLFIDLIFLHFLHVTLNILNKNFLFKPKNNRIAQSQLVSL